jgi:peptide/nickel transport system permease protein
VPPLEHEEHERPDLPRNIVIVTRFLLRRLVHAVAVMLGVALLTFLLFHSFAPDPVRAALGQHANPAAMAALRAQWGLDRPLPQQFGFFLLQILRFDFGKSFVNGDDLATLIGNGAWVSLAVTLPPFLAGLVISLGVALFVSRHPGGWGDRLSRVLFIGGMSVSALVYVIVGQYVLAFKLGWFPINGFEHGWAGLAYLVLPWLILLAVSIGPDVRLYRTVMLNEVRADYVRTARAKGASDTYVLARHVLPNAAIPIVTNTVTSLPFLILGSLLLERFFSIPGIGDVVVGALANGDFPVLKAVTVMSAFALVFCNLLTDLIYAWADPRVRIAA